LRGYTAATGATIAITFGHGGTWTLTRNMNDWSATDGATTPDAHVTFAPEITVRMLTRAIPAEEAAEGTTIDGDTELASGALAVTAPLLIP
jgi:hypothetical protein